MTRYTAMFVVETCLVVASSSVSCGGGPPAGASPAAVSVVPAESAAEMSCLERSTAPRAKRAAEPERVTVSHILVRHATSASPGGSTRTRGQACVRAEKARDKMREGADWDAVVAEFSDEPGAKSRSGSVGETTRAMLVPSFADAAFELEIQQLSDVVESKFGFHVILRTQ